MAETFLCDYCRAAIDPGLDSSLLVGVHRRVDADEWGDPPSEVVSGKEIAFRYCSQQHAGLHLERIPLPVFSRTEDDVTTEEAVWAVVVIGVVAAVGALAVYGGVQFWQEVASGWF
ncbi:hypothetical protein [Aeromicrobium panaciterrae]|uniref:hypothetical protein n=1 Tax=Aeromicrobium panaciterrae TaxID=363861 RepID=UPI0031D66BD0